VAIFVPQVAPAEFHFLSVTCAEDVFIPELYACVSLYCAKNEDIFPIGKRVSFTGVSDVIVGACVSGIFFATVK